MATADGKTLEQQIRDSSSFPAEYSIKGSYLASPGQRYLVGAVTRDARRRYLVFVNDCIDTSGKASFCTDPGTGTSNVTQVTLTLALGGWNLPAGTVLPVTMVATNRRGAAHSGGETRACRWHLRALRVSWVLIRAANARHPPSSDSLARFRSSAATAR